MIPRSLLPLVTRSKVDISTEGESLITQLRVHPNSGLTLGYTGKDPGTGLVTLSPKETGVGTAAAGLGLYKIRVDAYGRVLEASPHRVAWTDIDNRPDINAIVQDAVNLAIGQLNIPDERAIREIINAEMLIVSNDLKAYIDQRISNLEPGGLGIDAVNELIAAALADLDLPTNWTADGIIAVVNNGIASGAINIPAGDVNLSAYFNSQEGNALLTTVVTTVVQAILPDFLRQWFIDNPLDKPDCHMFICGFPSSGVVAGQVTNQPNNYKFGDPRLVSVGQPPTGDVQFVLRRNGNPIASFTVHTDGSVVWSDSGTVLTQFTDTLTVTTTDTKGASGVMVTLANADALVVDTTETITIPGTVAAPNNILHTLVPTNMTGAVVWMLLLPFDAVIDLNSFTASTSRAVSATPAAFKLWKGQTELLTFTFEPSSSTASVSNRLTNTVNGARGELLFIQCQSYSDLGTLLHNLNISPVDSVPGDFTLSGGHATSLNPVELFRYIAAADTTIDMNRAVFSAIVADPANQSMLYARVDGVGKSAIRFAANAKTGVLLGDGTIHIPSGSIFTIESASTSSLQGVAFSLIATLDAQPTWLKQEFNASYIGDAPKGAVIAADLVETNRVIDLTKCQAKLSALAPAGFALTLRRNGVAQATVTFNAGSLLGAVDTVPSGGTQVPLTVGDLVDVVVSEGTATRPAVTFVYV